MKSFDKLFLKLKDSSLVEVAGMDHSMYLFSTKNSPEFTGNPKVPTPDGSDPMSVVNVRYLNDTLGGVVNKLGPMTYKGVLSNGDSLPAAKSGDTYRSTGNFTINGLEVHSNDLLICKMNTEEGISSSWDVVCIMDDDKVVGIPSSVDNNLVAFDGTSGMSIKDSGVSTNDLITSVSGANGLKATKSGKSVTIELNEVNSITPYTENVITEESHTHQIEGFVSKVKDELMDGRLYVSNPSYNLSSEVEFSLTSLDSLDAYKSDDKLGIHGLGNFNFNAEVDGHVDPLSLSVLSIKSLKLIKSEMEDIKSTVVDLSGDVDSLSSLTTRLDSIESRLTDIESRLTALESKDSGSGTIVDEGGTES